MPDPRAMTTEVALLRAQRALLMCNDKRDSEAAEVIEHILRQRGMQDLEPGCDYLTTAIDVWVFG